MVTERASVSTTPTGRRRRISGKKRSRVLAAKAMAARSRRNLARTPGRNTFTATVRSPSGPATVALWTWAMEAAAIGSLSEENTAESGRPKDAEMIASASDRGKGGIRSCRDSRSRATRTPTTSGRVARNWPNLT